MSRCYPPPQPVMCYLCEKAAERWEISENVRDAKIEAIVSCHGQTEIIEIDSFNLEARIGIGERPIIAFAPVGDVCPTKQLLLGPMIDVTPRDGESLLLGAPQSDKT